MKISCCMIVKNEAEVLEETLFAARSFFDEIVVVDTGSKDETCKIAKKYCDKLEHYTWENDFSRARNYSISKADNDWVFILDADEKITNYQNDYITNSLIEKNNIFRVMRRNKMHNGLVYKEYIKRLFNRNNYIYEGIIHEQIIPINISIGRIYDTNIILDHIGYENEVINRTNKLNRNIELLKESLKRNNKDPYICYQLGKSYSLAGDFIHANVYFEMSISLIDNFSFDYTEDLIESYGYNLIQLKEYEKTMHLEKYYSLYSSKPDFCFLMGLIYMNNSYFDRAIQYFKKCIGKNNSRIEGVNSFLPAYNIGIIFECLGHINEASYWYSSCADYVPAAKRLALIKASL